jgi:DNA-binding NarL/FixJ family response regulator
MNRALVLVADDHEVVRLGIRFILRSHQDCEVAAEAADGREAVERTWQLKPDIVILDIGMPRLNGLDAARQILRKKPEQKVLLLTDVESEQVMREALRIGVKGFILKSDTGSDMLAAVEALQHGRTFFTTRMTEMVLSDFLANDEVMAESRRGQKLTPRQREIIQLVAEGKTTKQLSTILHMSVKTAETHRHNIMSRLKLGSVPELVLYAIRNNMIYVSNSGTSLGVSTNPTDALSIRISGESHVVNPQ